MYKILFPVMLIIYFIIKYRWIGQVEPGPIEGKILFPRQDARFAHTAMSILEVIFILEFISHETRAQDAWIRLIIVMSALVLVDGLFWLKLKNTGITYDAKGIIVRNFMGQEKEIPWEKIREVRTTGTGVKSTRVFIVKTTQGKLRINARSGGVERFRRYMEEKLSSGDSGNV